MKKGDCNYRNIHWQRGSHIFRKWYLCRRFNNNDIIVMTHSMIVWSCIITIIVLAFILRAVEKCYLAKDFRKRHIHLIEMSKEEEMFYCPGDDNMEEKDDSEN